MRPLGVIALVALPACDALWGIAAVGPPIDATDAPIFDAIDAANCRVIERPVNADVLLYSTNPTQGHQMEEIMNLGVAQSAEGLQRFTVPTLDAGEQLTAVQLVETYLAKSNQCGTSCGSCDSLDKPGTFEVSLATSTWNETYACRMYRDMNVAWTIGVVGGGTRSAPVATAPYAAHTNLVFDLPVDQVGAWIDNGQLSVIVSGLDVGQIVVAQKDYGSACMPAPQPVHVEFTACR